MDEICEKLFKKISRKQGSVLKELFSDENPVKRAIKKFLEDKKEILGMIKEAISAKDEL